MLLNIVVVLITILNAVHVLVTFDLLDIVVKALKHSDIHCRGWTFAFFIMSFMKSPWKLWNWSWIDFNSLNILNVYNEQWTKLLSFVCKLDFVSCSYQIQYIELHDILMLVLCMKTLNTNKRSSWSYWELNRIQKEERKKNKENEFQLNI